MGRRTSDPHPESFLAFACAVEEQLEYDRQFLPPTLPAETFEHRFPELIGKDRAAYAARKARELRAALKVEERVAHLVAGVPGEVLDASAGQLMLDRAVELRAALLSKLTGPPAERTSSGISSWRPARSIVVETIAGVFFAGNGARLADAVDVLNRGMPRSGRLQRVTASEIRNALHSYV